MKKTLWLVLAAISVFAVSGMARAEVAGQWETENAQITMIVDKQDQGTTSCKIVQLGLEQSANELRMTGYHMECGAMLVMDVEPHQFTIQDGGALLDADGQKVGALAEDGQSVEFSMDHDGLIRHVALFQSADSVKFQYFWTDGFTQLIVRGDVIRK